MPPVSTVTGAVEHPYVAAGDRRSIGLGTSAGGCGGGAGRWFRLGAVAAVVVGLTLVSAAAAVGAGHDGKVSGREVFGWQGVGGAAGGADAGRGVTVALVDTGVSDTPALDRASGDWWTA